MRQRKLRQPLPQHHRELPSCSAENELSPSHAMHSLVLSTKLVWMACVQSSILSTIYLGRGYSQRQKLANCIICRYISVYHTHMAKGHRRRSFFSGCHLFIPLFDPSYDTFESLRSRTPFCFDSILTVASKIRAGNGPPSQTYHHCLENAQGIARSTLFGPVVRKEAVQGG